jgi:hypothetical protein
MQWIRRPGIAVTVATLLCLLGIPLSYASAATSRARPAAPAAPAHKSGPFKIGSANSAGGGVAMEPSGSLVIAYTSSDTNLVVCTMGLGKRACGHKANLHALSGDTYGGTPQVFVWSLNHVAVLASTCCDANPDGDNLLYTSTDGGKTFSAPVRVGSDVTVNAAALAGSQIVFTQSYSGSWLAQAVSVTAPAPPASVATLGPRAAFAVAVGNYKDGALVASDYEGKSTTTSYVYYAAAGSDFSLSSSYKLVGKFDNTAVLAMSRSTLLTMQTKHGSSADVRKFNGHSFGTAHAVPHTAGGGAEWFTVCQAPDGHMYVFSERSGYKIYDLIEESSSTGSKWSKPVNLGNAIDSTYFDGAVNNSGKGLVLGTDPAWGYPVR